jgi:hypothetical protein
MRVVRGNWAMEAEVGSGEHWQAYFLCLRELGGFHIVPCLFVCAVVRVLRVGEKHNSVPVGEPTITPG